jgi:hypothetical protein
MGRQAEEIPMSLVHGGVRHHAGDLCTIAIKLDQALHRFFLSR